MNDDELRSALARRASLPLSADERTDVLRAARLEATATRRRSVVPRFAGLLAATAAVVVLVLIALPIVLSPPRPAAPSASPNADPSSQPAAGLHVYSAGQLSAMIGDPAWIGKTVLAQASIDHIATYGLCPPPDQPCVLGALHGVAGKSGLLFGWRDATPEDGVQFGSGNGYRWIKQLAVPGDPGTFAFTVRENQAEYLGPAALTADAGPVGVSDVLGVSSTLPTDTVVPVRGWLTKDWPVPSCPAPQQMLESLRPALDYFCENTWLSPEPDVPGAGVQVQNDAYEFFAANPSEGQHGADPQGGVYLVRNAGCPEAAPCPAWRMVGRLDDSSPAVTSPLPASPAPPSPRDRVSPPPTAIETPLPAAVPVYSAQELSDMIGDPSWVGKTVIGDVSFDPIVRYSGCTGYAWHPELPCVDATLHGVTGQADVSFGWRDATPEEGYQYDLGNGLVWIKPLEVPTASGLFAFTIRDDFVDYLGPAWLSPDGGPLLIENLAQYPGKPSDDVFVVRGWLGHTLEAPCAFPEQGLASPPPDISSYYCGGSWLTADDWDPATSGLKPDGYHMQNDAYASFAPDPQPADGGGWVPREGVYLFRDAGCPEVVSGDCPVSRMVGRLDDVGLPIATPPPGSSPPPDDVLHFFNGSTLPLDLSINGQHALSAPPQSNWEFDPTPYAQPWLVAITFTTGREVLRVSYDAKDTYTRGNESGGVYKVAYLSCGRILIYANGPPSIYYGAPSSYPPGDCDP